MVLAWVIAGWSQVYGLDNRVANTTLRMPEQPPAASYTLSNDFPNLSLRWPVGLVTPPGETNRLFILEREGRVTGHGHLGWTLAAASGELFADVVAGASPKVDPGPYDLRRFG